MSDISEEFAAMKEQSKIKKIDNMKGSMALLDKFSIDYEVKNNGIHVIVTGFNSELIDFYPTTGKWIVRESDIQKRGVHNLIRYLTK